MPLLFIHVRLISLDVESPVCSQQMLNLGQMVARKVKVRKIKILFCTSKTDLESIEMLLRLHFCVTFLCLTARTFKRN